MFPRGEIIMPLTRLNCEEIKEGVSFSAPVFFEDSVNMFLAANHPAKHYHVVAIERWKIPFLMTAGHKNTCVIAASSGESDDFDMDDSFSGEV